MNFISFWYLGFSSYSHSLSHKSRLLILRAFLVFNVTIYSYKFPPALLFLHPMFVYAAFSFISKYFLFVFIFIYLWLYWVFIAVHRIFVAARGFSLAAASKGYSLVAEGKFLIAVASPVAEHRL